MMKQRYFTLALVALLQTLALAANASETYESAGVSVPLTFDIQGDNAISTLLEAGGGGYSRANLGWAAQGNPQHWFKFAGEYLLEHQDINFEVDPRPIWVKQYAGGATYQFFPNVNWPVAFLANAYGSYMPSEQPNTVQHISQAAAYGGNLGMTVLFASRTQVEASVRYDRATFDNSFGLDNTTEQGIGGSGFIKQYIGCDLNMIGGADITSIYNNYYVAFNMLFPFRTMAFVMGVKGEFNDPHDNLSHSLLGMVTLGLEPQQTCSKTETPNRETLSSFVSRPAVYMPTVLAHPVSTAAGEAGVGVVY